MHLVQKIITVLGLLLLVIFSILIGIIIILTSRKPKIELEDEVSMEEFYYHRPKWLAHCTDKPAEDNNSETPAEDNN
jgi:hypothetical protein